jgi:hypothetical protein
VTKCFSVLITITFVVVIAVVAVVICLFVPQVWRNVLPLLKCPFKMLVTMYQTTQFHNPDGQNIVSIFTNFKTKLF